MASKGVGRSEFQQWVAGNVHIPEREPPGGDGDYGNDTLFVLLPLLIALSTLLFLLLLFLIFVILLRRRRGIHLRDHDGPVDMSREERIDEEGGFDGVEERWLEASDELNRRHYHRAKQYQVQYPPNSIPTDITLSQFLSIQEKGVSAWCFEPDYESLPSLLVHARTELTFLPDPTTTTSVQSNLPLPKLNEVYYWEVKMFDLPSTTRVSVGLATKPYPAFRLPGLNRYSVAYHSNGEKSHNYPFTATSFGPALKEGDVLGIGYRPRTGTVFFTRNGRKMEDAFVGLTKWNLFPTIGADGPCSVHVNLGQAGFVFIEANVKKWGLAPSVGTLAPPPAYGSERGSILLEAGGTRTGNSPAVRYGSVPSPSGASSTSSSPSSSSFPRRHRTRRPKPPSNSTAPVTPSPLRSVPISPPPPFVPSTVEETIEEALAQEAAASSEPASSLPMTASDPSGSAGPRRTAQYRGPTPPTLTLERPSPSPSPRLLPLETTPDSPFPPNPPTPNLADIRLNDIPHSRSSSSNRTHSRESIPVRTTANRNESDESNGSDDSSPSQPPSPRSATADTIAHRQPPAYSPLDAFTYADGVHIDLPAEVIAAALEAPPFQPAGPLPSGRRGGGGR